MSFSTDTTINHIMHSQVLCAEDTWSMEQLARFFTDQQISGAPVVDGNGVLVGVVSLTDIVRQAGAREFQTESHSTHDYYLSTLERQVTQEEMANFHVEQESPSAVSDIMTPMIFQVNENATIQEAADTMVKGHIHRLFVTRDNKISGVVTALDMLEVIRNPDGYSDAARQA